jgi:hypothetical protein
MKELIANLLVPAGTFFLSIVAAVPIWTVRLLFIGLLAIVCLWIFSLSPQIPESGKTGITRDLRYFAALVLALQALCYIVF